MALKTIEEHNEAVEAARKAAERSGIACPKCEAELLWDSLGVMTSPPRRGVRCPGCGWYGQRNVRLPSPFLFDCLFRLFGHSSAVRRYRIDRRAACGGDVDRGHHTTHATKKPAAKPKPNDTPKTNALI